MIKKVPLGPPLKLTDKQLDEASRITEVDIETARVFWRANAPKKFKTLLDAQPVHDDQVQPDGDEE